MGPENGGESECSNADPDTFAHLGGRVFDGCHRAAPVAGRLDRSRFGWAGEGTSCPAVDLDAAAHHDVFERRAFGSCTDDRRCCLVGERRCVAWCGTGVGLPDTDVDENVGIEVDDGVDDSFVLVGVNAVEHRAIEASTGWIGIDARQRTDPVFGFEETRHQRAEFTPDATDEHPTSSHELDATRPPTDRLLGQVGGRACRYHRAWPCRHELRGVRFSLR